MHDLISTLKQQHETVREILDKMRDPYNSLQKRQELFESFRELIISHIDTEDNHLYTELYGLAENNNRLQRKLETFANKWEEISQFVKYYFEKYQENQNSKEFINDTVKLTTNLKYRMMQEEIGLFPEFEKLSQS